MADNPQTMYTSAGMPLGTRTITVYRNTSPPTAPTFPLSVAANVQSLGAYNLEMFGWKSGAKEVDRNTPIGADLDFALIRQKITASATAQLATGFTPLLREGIDMFETSPGYEKDGVTPLPLQRFVIVDASKDENEGAAQKQGLTVRFDRQNSDPFWQT